MERRTQHYRDDYKSPGQEFDKYRKEYRLNESTNCLEEDGLVDISEEVNSFRDLALDKQLERFLPPAPDFEQGAVVDGYLDALDQARAYRDKIESYRDQFGFDDDQSDSDILAEVARRADALAQGLKKYQNPAKESKQEELKDNEEIPQNEQKEVV